MSVNNYRQIQHMANELGYTDKWVLLRFIRRRTETGEKNKVLTKKFIKFEKINIDEITLYCDKNQCRCYLTFLDNILESAWKALGSPLDKINSWRNEELFDMYGLHLIDVDDLTLERDHILWLENKGVEHIFVLPSKTGHSILFYSNSNLILEYQKTGWENINNFHMMATINLYIPDFS